MTASESDPPITENARQYLRLHLAEGVGPVLTRRLIARFGSVAAIMSASIAELEQVEGVRPRIAESIFKSRNQKLADLELERAAECGLRVLCFEDADFPDSLRYIADPPVCLYVRGKLEPADVVAMAIVGKRSCSHYGREQAVRFGEMLGAAGFTIISGMARGIDGHAHRGALRSGGRTIAVLGNGLGTVYPPEHRELADEIARSGAVVSELPIDAQPAPENFPRRNRIITGLALGVIVIEAGPRSGALITARLASEYNREAFAVPGRVDRPDLTAGVHGLIRDGQAKLVTCLEDVLDELGEVGDIMGRGTKPPESETAAPSSSTLQTLTTDERTVYDAVAEESVDADAIVSTTGLEMSRVLSCLTSLQLKGLLRQHAGSRFVQRTTNPPDSR
ncbi:MAG: DNA-processing protein DprA [Phycisphaerae bacterium]|jgi:DNA processing protein